MDECDDFCAMIEKSEVEFCAWMDRVFESSAPKDGHTFETFQAFALQKARYHDFIVRVRQYACSGKQLVAVRAEIERWRASLITQQENLASYALRAGRDLARAEEQALRPHMQKLLPVLDALDLARSDSHRPECDPANLRDALSMIKDGLSGHIEGVRGVLPAPKSA